MRPLCLPHPPMQDPGPLGGWMTRAPATTSTPPQGAQAGVTTNTRKTQDSASHWPPTPTAFGRPPPSPAEPSKALGTPAGKAVCGHLQTLAPPPSPGPLQHSRVPCSLSGTPSWPAQPRRGWGHKRSGLAPTRLRASLELSAPDGVPPILPAAAPQDANCAGRVMSASRRPENPS